MLVPQVILAAATSCVWNGALEFTGATATMNSVSYWIPPDPVASMNNSLVVQKLQHYAEAAGGLLPLTVVESSFGKNTSESPSQTFVRYGDLDDVWQESFSKVIYIPSKANEDVVHAQSSSVDCTEDRCVLREGAANPIGQNISEGPYFFSSMGLHRAYRLYSDRQGAFSESMYTNSTGQHSVLPASLPGPSLAVAVPSRLYYKRSAEKPLAGIRLGVKDVFDISGVKTGNGNRQWYSFYASVNSTALPVERLIEAGAIVVGKMKTAQFANMEYGNSDWIDYQCPFNPRGDGYQDPNASSAGPGAGIAAYPWLDAALGTDTGGSIRGPARVQGLYALRPSYGLAALTHTTPVAPEFDTAALIVRDPTLLRDGSEVMYKQPTHVHSQEYPRRILATDLTAGQNMETAMAINRFMDGLKKFLNVQEATNFDMDSTWQKHKPQTAPRNLTALLNTTYSVMIAQRQSKLVRDPFYADYAREHDGRRPFIDPVPLVRWSYGDSLPETAAEEAIRQKNVFMDWFQEHILKADSKTCSDSILVYSTPPRIVYRNTYRREPGVPFGFAPRFWSVMAESPDLVVTVGETSYHSEISGHVEKLPVTVNLLAAKGCDFMLLDLVVDLVDAGVLKVVATGASAMYGGQILA